MKYLIIAIAIAAIFWVIIRGAGGDVTCQLQGPPMLQMVLVPTGDAVPFCTPLRGTVGGVWKVI